jgi:hypothetical protein
MVSWTRTEIQLLLTLIQEREALYDIANEDYTNRDIVWALWTDIARQLNKTRTYCSVGSVGLKLRTTKTVAKTSHTFVL